ncbi:DUF4297 domain-containing protein [Paenibacillus sp. BT-177]|uniref:DUF4297 domain-containing protein n=1 Tax=Paenibacillus sp. BT-177 TaxID=2986930 RepID=UPI0021F77512|nr:DUF4297 domain-containing protein [Paenibacillus sp. BT-177]
MVLKDLVVQKKPRESSGSRSANRFDFQKDWAILKLFELHQYKDDYLLVLDYHDDVMVLDSEYSPQTAAFYQLKTKDNGIWKLNEIINSKKGKKGPLPSIIGKLYGCKLTFPNNTLSLTLVSNACFEISLQSHAGNSTDKKSICFTDIEQKDLGKIITAIKTEHALKDEPDFVEITFLEVTDLNIKDRETYMKGKLHEFLESMNPKNGKFRLSLIYNAIFGEVKRKNDYEWSVSNFDDVKKYKGISRSQFQDMLSHFDIDNEFEQTWEEISNRLNVERVDFKTILKLKNAWKELEVVLMDAVNEYFQSQQLVIKEILNEKEQQPFSFLYQELVKSVYAEYMQREPKSILDEHMIKATILMEYCRI